MNHILPGNAGRGGFPCAGGAGVQRGDGDADPKAADRQCQVCPAADGQLIKHAPLQFYFAGFANRQGSVKGLLSFLGLAGFAGILFGAFIGVHGVFPGDFLRRAGFFAACFLRGAGRFPGSFAWFFRGFIGGFRVRIRKICGILRGFRLISGRNLRFPGGIRRAALLLWSGFWFFFFFGIGWIGFLFFGSLFIFRRWILCGLFFRFLFFRFFSGFFFRLRLSVGLCLRFLLFGGFLLRLRLFYGLLFRLWLLSGFLLCLRLFLRMDLILRGRIRCLNLRRIGIISQCGPAPRRGQADGAKQRG